MSPARDANLMLRQTSDGNLTETAVVGPVEIEGTPIKGLAVRISCPSAFTGTSPTLVAYVRSSTSTDPSTTDPIVGEKTITAYGDYIIPIVTNHRSVDVELAVSGTSPNLGAVEVGIVENVGWPWDRSVSNFH